jgi:cell division protease FtsH
MGDILFKRIRVAVSNHPIATVAVTAIVFGSTLGLIARAATHSATPVLSKISVTDQLENIAYADDLMTLTTLTTNKERIAAGLLPISILSSSQYLDLLKVSTNHIPMAIINPDLRITDAVITDKAGKQTIYATYFLSSQSAQFLALYSKGSAQVNITPTPVARGVPVSAYNGRASGTLNPTRGSSNTSGGGPSGGLILFFILLLIGIIIGAMRYTHMRNARLTKMKKPDNAGIPKVLFEDVAGCEEAVEDVREIVIFLQHPEYFTRVGAKCPKGALLMGPPGTGKTLLAKAIAGEAGVPFYHRSAAEFEERFVGVGASRIREIFKEAGQHPEGAILFIDEIDAIGGRRGGGGDGASVEHSQTLNQLLTQMDGIEDSRVIVIAATNRSDILDPALMRPGRFDKKIYVGIPDRLGREKILAVHAKGKPLDVDVDLTVVAKRTSGMSGADLAEVVNGACMITARSQRDTVTAKDFDIAVYDVLMGKARVSAVVKPRDREITAWHEAGHTVLGMILEDALDPASVSIIPRGPAGGITAFSDNDDMFLTRKGAFAQLVVGMGGRAGEELLLNGEYTSGPHGDLKASTDIALSMVMNYGMSGKGLMVKSASMIDDATVEIVEKLLADALVLARSTINSHRSLFDALVKNLLEYDTLAHSQLEDIKNGAEITPPPLPSAPLQLPKFNAPEVKPRKKQTVPDTDPRDTFDAPVPLKEGHESAFPNPFRKKKKAVVNAILSIVLATGEIAETFIQLRKKDKPAGDDQG